MRTQRIALALLLCGTAFMTGCPFGADPFVGIGDPAFPGTPVPDGLIGKWRTVLTYVPGYYTGDVPLMDFTGSLGVYYYFGADGQYRYDLDSAVASGFCIRTTSWSEWGTLGIAGADVTLTPARATNVITDRCGESVLDDNAPTAAATLRFTREQDPSGWPMLRLRLPSGEELLLEKCRDCE